MKILIQIILGITLLVFIYFTYKIYFYKKTRIIQTSNNLEIKDLDYDKKNSIKDLEYQVNLQGKGKYVIRSKLGNFYIENNSEIVKMQDVKAILFGKNNISLTITSKFATFIENQYETRFNENVIILYLDHKINSDFASINFKDNKIFISKDVIYKGSHGKLMSDNIIIDLITKKIDIYMNNIEEKVKIFTNN